MNDPKLKRTSVTVRYTADDGYRSETTYTTNGHHPPIPAEIPLLDALEELARLTALFGFHDEAKARFDAAQKRVADWREGRKVGAGTMATEGHNVEFRGATPNGGASPGTQGYASEDEK